MQKRCLFQYASHPSCSSAILHKTKCKRLYEAANIYAAHDSFRQSMTREKVWKPLPGDWPTWAQLVNRVEAHEFPSSEGWKRYVIDLLVSKIFHLWSSMIHLAGVYLSLFLVLFPSFEWMVMWDRNQNWITLFAVRSCKDWIHLCIHKVECFIKTTVSFKSFWDGVRSNPVYLEKQAFRKIWLCKRVSTAITGRQFRQISFLLDWDSSESTQ